jgi:hypothetical protein
MNTYETKPNVALANRMMELSLNDKKKESSEINADEPAWLSLARKLGFVCFNEFGGLPTWLPSLR